jgi:hypothetical protein
VRTYQHVSIPINVLVGVEELAAVRYANEQCTAPPGLNGGLCNLCCFLGRGDDIVVGWKAFFDVGEAGTAAREPTQQVSYAACTGGKGGGQGGQSCNWR